MLQPRVNIDNADQIDSNLRNLCSAVLRRALLDVVGKDKTVKQDAIEWLRSESEEPFSFLAILAYLDLLPYTEKIRGYIDNPTPLTMYYVRG